MVAQNLLEIEGKPIEPLIDSMKLSEQTRSKDRYKKRCLRLQQMRTSSTADASCNVPDASAVASTTLNNSEYSSLSSYCVDSTAAFQPASTVFNHHVTCCCNQIRPLVNEKCMGMV